MHQGPETAVTGCGIQPPLVRSDAQLFFNFTHHRTRFLSILLPAFLLRNVDNTVL